jgi:small subunit ribosomal protein S13
LSGPSKSTPENPDDFKYIVRIANTDLDGHRTVPYALTSIKGFGTRSAEVVVREAGVSRSSRIGDLPDGDIEKITAEVENYFEKVPDWLLNRRKDYSSGADTHIYGTDVEMVRKDDVNRMKKIRCYRGVRHENGHKVRGQRTRCNGRSGLAVGVVRKKR